MRGMSTIKRLANLSETEQCELEKVLEALPPLIAGKTWIAGGAIRRTISGKPLDSDFDIFFSGDPYRIDFTDRLKAKGAVLYKSSDNNDSYDIEVDGKKRRIQLIKVLYPETAHKLIDEFDFTICQLAYDGADLTIGEFTLWDIARKRLAVHKITRHVSSMRRLLKYVNEGYYACQGCLTDFLLEARKATEGQIREVFYVD